jgi:uncharacterized protein (DUF2267 family)
MSTTGLANFDTTVSKTNEVLHAIADANGWPQENHKLPYHALRAVLHALRDRLIVDEAAQFAAQLPVLIRGVFYEGWVPSRVPVKMDREAFLERVRAEFPYEVEGGIDRLVTSVLRALQRFVTRGEWEDIASVVPEDLRELIPA